MYFILWILSLQARFPVPPLCRPLPPDDVTSKQSSCCSLLMTSHQARACVGVTAYLFFVKKKLSHDLGICFPVNYYRCFANYKTLSLIFILLVS